MQTHRSILLVAAGVIFGLTAGGTGFVLASSGKAAPAVVKVCVTKKGVVRSANADGTCPDKTSKMKINRAGPAGPAGPTGAAGPAGGDGSDGSDGSDWFGG